MRYSNLAAAVLFGVGICTAPAGAQQTPPAPPLADATHNDPFQQQMLSRRARAALEALLKAERSDAIRFQFNGDVEHLRPPVDCGMPVIKGDPAIDPLFSKQPRAQMAPGSPVRHTMTVVPVEPCRR